MTKRPCSAIRIGVGGWTYEPWRGTFYPVALPRKQELAYAARQLTSIEIDGTYYRLHKPESFARWRDETPDHFVFSLKAPRFVTNRRVLADAGAAMERFFVSGITELQDKLGPINWQFMPTKQFDPEDFASFLRLLPKRIDGLEIRHAVEVRHESFGLPDFVALAREHGVAIVLAGDSKYPQIADYTAPFVYVRLMGTQETEPLGYSSSALDLWAHRARDLAAGVVPQEIRTVAPGKHGAAARDVYLYVISGHKVRNPAAAGELIRRVGENSSERAPIARSRLRRASEGTTPVATIDAQNEATE
jgi:uncharacterized protein YecE (DUF72 family)